MSIRTAIARRPLAAFVALAYGLTWTCWLTAQALYPPSLPLAQRAPGSLLLVLGTFGPFVSALVVARVAGEWAAFRGRLLRFGVGLRWYVVAVALPVVSVVAGYLVFRLLGGAPMRAEAQLAAPALVGAFVFTLVAGGGNEEPGWRGFALPRLQARFGPFVGTLVLTVVWAGWHLPAFLDPASSQSAVPPLAWLGSTLAISFVLTWLFNVAGESVPVAALFHAAFNTAGLVVITALPPDAVAPFYWTALAIFLGAVGMLLLVTRRRLGFDAGRAGGEERPAASDGDRAK